MSVDRTKIYDSGLYFFELNGSVIMKLTPDAAIEVCKNAVDEGLLVVRVEGGIFHEIGFEARLDCIWDSKINPPVQKDGAHESNLMAADFIESEKGEHNAFIITTTSKCGSAVPSTL